MKKKLISMLLVSALAVSCLAGCGNSGSDSASNETNDTTAPAADSSANSTEGGANEQVGAQITVDESATDNIAVEGEFSDADITVFIYAQDHEKAVYQSLIDKFTESTGANVTFEVTTADEYGQKILAYKAAGDMPDIFYVGPDTVAANVDDGYVLPLDDYVPAETINDLWPAITEAYRYDGTQAGAGPIYCLPKDLSTFAFAYNKTLFDEAGVEYPDPENPYTWEEFLEVCGKLTIDKDGDGEIDQWGCANALQWALDAFIYTNGGHFLNEDYTQVVIDGQQEFIDAFQYFADVICCEL